ncbi:DUF6177 family protein [Microbacterium sp. NPDC057407]|uniref:DUF6177 family protein n=1 Tax=Microbacterium sp. NPDC057407 TaxID=3346120 RepID=UPI00366B368E
MTAATAAHPLVDGSGPGWVATETRADIVGLNVGMSDLLGRVASDGDRPLVVSGEFSRMTRPLAEVLSALQGHWVIRTSDDGCYDAATGARLRRPEDVLGPRATDVHPAFLRGAVATRLQVVTTVSTRHRVSRPVRLGGVLEAAADAFAGHAPDAWGPTEPLVAPWDRDQLTEYSRRRMPSDSRWAAVAHGERPLIGTMHLARTREGLEETTHVWADVAGAGDARIDAVGAEARALLAKAAGIGMPLLGVSLAAIGAPDLTRRPIATPPPEPLALLVGPAGVRALDLDPRRWATDFGAAMVGSPRLPGVLVSLGGASGGGWARLSEVLGTLDPDRLAQLLAIAPSVAARLRTRGLGGSPERTGGA